MQLDVVAIFENEKSRGKGSEGNGSYIVSRGVKIVLAGLQPYTETGSYAPIRTFPFISSVRNKQNLSLRRGLGRNN